MGEHQHSGLTFPKICAMMNNVQWSIQKTEAFGMLRF